MPCCSKCHVEKDETAFYPARRKANGRGSWCKKCMAEHRDKWRAANPDRVKEHYRAKSLRVRYGIGIRDYEALNEAQDGKCAICRKPERQPSGNGQPRRLAVDHDKTTGKVRGLLCRYCNQALGRVGDDIEGVRKFLSYLESPPADQVTLPDPNRWSRCYDRCVECGRDDVRYGGHGYCHPCNVRRLRRIALAESGQITEQQAADLTPLRGWSAHEKRYGA